MRGSQARGWIAVRAVLIALAAPAALVFQPAVGSAAQKVITSAGPLEAIYIDEDLGCQVKVPADTSPSFFGGTEPGGCGTFLALTAGENVGTETQHLFGPPVGPRTDADFTPLGGVGVPDQTLSGSGTSTDPFIISTRVTVNEPTPGGGAVVGLSETDSYVTGQDSYQTTIALVNLSHTTALTGALYHAGDCYLANLDEGYGATASGTVACTIAPENNPATGFMSFTPILTTGAGISGPHYFESNFSTVWGAVTPEAAQFPDTAAGVTRQDNGMGLSWPVALPPEGSGGVAFTTTVAPGGALPTPEPPNPCAGIAAPTLTITSDQGRNSYVHGEPASVTITAAGAGLTSNPSAAHVPISTAATGSFTVTRSATSACGTTNASFTYTVTPATLATLPPPVLGASVNVEPVSGQVFVKLPASAKASLAGPLDMASESLSKGIGFIPLSEARQIPVGSILDTSAGVARINTATIAKGKIGEGDFGAGIFKLLQQRKQRGLTELDMIDNHSPKQVCASTGKGRKAAAARLSGKVLGRLTVNSHGKFTAHGQYSSATVRGTTWNVANRCDGTLTRVVRGVLSVRDFHRRKTITLTTGQSYLAKAPHA